jgi:translation initiation factor 3 subunit M
MSAYTTLLEPDEEAALKIVYRISDMLNDSSFVQECKGLIETGETQNLISKILSVSNDLIAHDAESDTIGIFQALVMFLFNQDEEKTTEIVRDIANALTISTDNKTELRLRILVCLFNQILTTSPKVMLLKTILRYASDSNLSSLVTEFYERIEGWIVTFDINKEDQRELLLLIATTLESNEKISDSLEFLVKYLDTYKGETFPDSVQAIATTAVVNAIKAPVASFKYRTLLESSLSSQELGSQHLADLVELLSVLCTGTLQEYNTFEANRGRNVMIKHNIDSDNVLRNMRLLTLCNLCANVRCSAYIDIARELNINEDDVEMWIVDAISEGLIDGTMDQTTNTFGVTRATYRRFGMEQWKMLQNKLSKWRANLQMMVDTIEQSNSESQ